MNPLDDLFLNAILRVDSNNILFQKEDINFEYKQFFDRDKKDARAKYAKELAALFNCEGGYLIFGVEDKKSELVGLTNFTEPDNALLSGDINSYFSPAFPFVSKTFMVGGKTLFIVYVEKRKSIPTICIKEHNGVLSDATIYWRYSGQSAPIKSGDLINLLHSLREEESVRIASTKLKLDYKPYLKLKNGHGGNGAIQLNISNEGERARIEQINLLEGDVISGSYATLPHNLAKDQVFAVSVKTNSAPMFANTTYKLEFIYTDKAGTRYKAIGEFRGINGSIGEPQEI